MPVVNDYTALLSGKSWSGNNAQNAPVLLTYSFATQIPDYLLDAGYTTEAIASFRAFSSAEQEVARSALQKWADISGIQFIEVTTGLAEIVFSKLNFSLFPFLRDSLGYSFFGDRSITPTKVWSDAAPGDVLIDLDHATNPFILLHEIGHALGLKHPFSGQPTLGSSLDNHAYTVMSYAGDFRSVLGTLDIQAVQSIYGNASSDGTNLASWSWNAAAGILTQVGKSTNDTIFGTGQSDIVRGEDGDDILAGYAGADRLDGGSGNDILFGGDGDDVLVGGPGDDILYGGDGKYYGGSPGDAADYSTSVGPVDVDLNARMEGGVYREATASGSDIGIDTLFGILRIVGSASGDVIRGSFRSETLSGGAGDDILRGNGGTDKLDGGAGTADWIDLGFTEGGVSLALNGDTDAAVERRSWGAIDLGTVRNVENVLGGLWDDMLSGDGLANELHGLGGNDVLKGGAGNDVLRGGAGKDILDGGSGMRDWADFSDELTRSVLVVLSGSNDSVATIKGFAEDTIRNIENVQGGLAGDRLVGDALENELRGLDGNDILRGGEGNDILDGGDDADYWSVYDGVWLDYNHDWLGGYFGDWADYGDKTVAISAALNTGTDVVVLVGGVAEDIIRNIENLHGGAAGDVLTGNDLVNQLWGWEGNDFLRGGGGKDVLSGGAGIDWADYSDKSAAVSVTLQWNGTSLAMVDGVMEDTLYNIENVQGGSGNDVIWGNSEANELRGLDGNDSLAGDAGNDTLTGGAGDDVLDGGAGQDTAFFSGNYAQYSIVVSDLTAKLVGPDGTDVVKNVETFVFNDRTVAITGAIRNDDFNGDSKADILWRNDNGGTYLWNSTAGVGFAGQDIGPAGSDWHIQDVADFNGDGKADILWRNDNGGTYLWNSTPGAGVGFAGQDIGPAGSDWHIQDAADFNGDGKADILWRNDTGGTYLWNSTPGAGVGFAGQDIGPAGSDWHIQDAADFNGDGKADILWRNDNGGTYLWNSTAGVGFAGQDTGPAGNDWHIQDAADFNGDGKADILWRNDNGGTYLWNSTAGVGFAGQDIGPAGNDWHIQA